jgi:two-component system response regulator FixJ
MTMPNSTVLLVDDDPDVRDSLKVLLEATGLKVRDFDSAKAVLALPELAQMGCLIADIRMPDMDGLALQEELTRRKVGIPVIVITGHGDVPLAVRAMKAGAVDFIEKPFDDALILASIGKALTQSRESRNQAALASAAEGKLSLLTARERQVLEQLVSGRSNKIIAYELDISPRTVEIHRAHLMEKMEAQSLSDLVRTALTAGIGPVPQKDQKT